MNEIKGSDRVGGLLEVNSPTTFVGQPLSGGESAKGTGFAGVDGSSPSLSTFSNELPLGYALEQDQDGDWLLLPPMDVTLVSVPGEGLLIGSCDPATAKADALAYLATVAAA